MSLHAQRAPWRAGFGSADARGFFFQAEDGIRDGTVTEVQTCALPISRTTRRRLLKGGGVVTTTRNTGQQWDAPNGWAPLQWIAVAGFNAYGEAALAEEIACRWSVNVARAYRESGKLLEKYDVMNTDRPGGGGEYPLQDGFGWTNGVARKLLALYPAHTDYRSVDECRRPRPAAHPGAAVDK